MAKNFYSERPDPGLPFPEVERGSTRSPEAPAAPSTSIGDRVLHDIARMVKGRLNASGVAIAIDLEGSMTCRARAGQAAPELGTPVQRDRGVTGECVSTGAVIRCDDTRSDTRVNPFLCEQLGIRSILLTPLVRRGEVAGVIEAFSPVRYGFDDRAVQWLQSVARQIVRHIWGEQETPDEAPERVELPPTSEAREQARTLEQMESGTESDNSRLISEPLSLGLTDDRPVAQEPAQPEPERELEPATSLQPQKIAIIGVAFVALAVAGILYSHYNSTAETNRTASVPTDPAAELLRAAETGDASAQYRVAQAYKNGSGATADPQQATMWLQRAAENGNADAQLQLARELELNQEDNRLVQAYTWYVIAGQSGKAESEEAIRRLTPNLSAADIAQVRYNVGEKFANGHALPLDPVAAYFWFALSEWGGNKNARTPIRQLESQLEPAQLREAKTRASTWIRRHSAPAAQRQNP